MANKGLLKKLGIKLNIPEKEINRLANAQAITIGVKNASKPNLLAYGAIPFGVISFAEGFADLGCYLVNQFSTNYVATGRNFDSFSIAEIALGIGIAYAGVKKLNRQKQQLKNIALSLKDNYIKD